MSDDMFAPVPAPIVTKKPAKDTQALLSKLAALKNEKAKLQAGLQAGTTTSSQEGKAAQPQVGGSSGSSGPAAPAAEAAPTVPAPSAYSFVPQNAEKFSLNPQSEEDRLLQQEYDPSEPNNYDEIVKKRRRLEEEAAVQRLREKNAERQRKQNEAKQAKETEEDDAATAYMKKFGWQEGQGLGRDGQGITAPLIMRKTDAGSGQVVQGTSLPKTQQGKSNVIVLLNAVGRGQVDDDLKDEMTEEASKYGKVNSCEIVEVQGVTDKESVRIFIEYANVNAGVIACMKFKNRFFGGRYVNCIFYNPERYRGKQFLDPL
ncbi:unnamed protein product [Amoebophrya sp. A25]|nr:unnamed protein product [Amoebophrya sp. A25]|eukprot:GSA25T00001210001.1